MCEHTVASHTRAGNEEHALVAVETADRHEDVGVGIESEEIAATNRCAQGHQRVYPLPSRMPACHPSVRQVKDMAVLTARFADLRMLTSIMS